MRKRVCLLLGLLLFALAAGAEEAALTNQDVVKMVSAGLSEEVIIAKVREAPRTDFRLGVDDLVGLRKAGVGEKVVAAMLDRNRPAEPSPQTAMHKALGISTIDVSLKAGETAVPIAISRGERSTAGFMGWGNTFINYQGLHAKVRTTERRPTLLIRSDVTPTWNHYFFGKLDVDEKNGVRSLKIIDNRKQAPDPDWTVAFDVAEEGEGLWKVTPKSALPPGEYGWFADLYSGLQGNGLFDFGVD